MSSFLGKPASASPFHASETESARARASSPRPACSRFRFSALALVSLHFVHHGDSRPEAKMGLDALEDMDN